MTEFRVIIKGTPAQARAAAARYSVVLNNVRANARKPGEVNADASAPHSAIAAWFGEEPRRAPFPPGALLWFGTFDKQGV